MIPLSSAQRRLWLIDQLETPGATYNIPVLLHLRGPVDVTAWRAALTDLIERHETLRTRITTTGDEPAQTLHHTIPDPLTAITCTPDQLDERIDAAVRHVFRLDAEPPIRTTLISTAPTSHTLVIVLHHTAADGWSMDPLLRDLATAYTARIAGTAPEWTPLPIQYADYTLWHQQLLGDEHDPTSIAGHQLSYWRTTLADLPPELPLPTDRPRPTTPTHAAGHRRASLGPELTAAVSALAEHTNTTTYLVLQTALATLLHHLTGTNDIPVGSVVTGRTDESLNDLVGLFVNTLVLRTNTTGNPTYRQLLHRVRTTTLTAWANQDIPFDRVVHTCQPPRATGRPPLCQTMLVMQNNTTRVPRLPRLAATLDLAHPLPTTKFDLLLTYTPQDDDLHATVEYNTDLYDQDTISRFTERLHTILRRLTQDLDQHIDAQDVLLPDERWRLANE